MQILFPKNYRSDDLSKITEIVETHNKIFISYLFDVGKNPFCKYLFFVLKEQFNKLVFYFDARNNTDLLPKFKSELSTFLNASLNVEDDDLKEEVLPHIKKSIDRLGSRDKKLILLVQANYLNNIDDPTKELLNIILELREYNPLNVVPIINAYWTHDTLDKLHSSSLDYLFNGINIYHGPFTHANFEEALYYFQKKNGELTEHQKELFYNLSGGIPYLYKQIYLHSKEHNISYEADDFLDGFISGTRNEKYIKQLLNDLGPELADGLTKTAKNENKLVPETVMEKLIHLGLIDPSTHSIKSLAIQMTLQNYKEGLEIIQIHNKNIYEIFTQAEAEIVKLFINNRGNLVEREKVAQTLWGNNFLEKYSDYAIDRHISNIRAKIKTGNLGVIKTVQGKGFIFKENN